jgi:hypothetical protein
MERGIAKLCIGVCADETADAGILETFFEDPMRADIGAAATDAFEAGDDPFFGIEDARLKRIWRVGNPGAPGYCRFIGVCKFIPVG